MKESSDVKAKKEFTREAIIGLGEASFRKNYYSELQEKLLDLERTNIRNKALITTIPDVLLVSDLEGNIAPFARASRKENPIAYGILEDELLLGELREVIQRVVETRELVTYNFRVKRFDSVFYLEARIHISEIDEILIIIRDMTERALLEKKLRFMAERDSLTKLFNRLYFEEQLNKYENTFVEKFTLLLLDIDGLKLMNDTLGHLYGDLIIMAVADIISVLFGDIGCVSRVGGDEFGILLDGLSQLEIEGKLNELKNMVREYNEKTDTLKVSISFGYSHCKNVKVNSKWMFQEADNNMYQNKLLKEASNRSSLVKTLMKALEARDFITEGHAERMEANAVRMGEYLKLSQKQMDRIKLLVKFHDIGKVGIPDIILNKPSRLTEEEWKIMKTHSNIGKRIAEASTELEEIAQLILMHHERWDGQGYPLGVKGEDIPIECRILSIVDAYDAMTNDRPYRKAMPEGAAEQQLEEGAGSQFDSNLVRAFKEIIEGRNSINE
ncbi:MAG: HD domain-containing phosphohydrolase [Pseudomonadota bacterium]